MALTRVISLSGLTSVVTEPNRSSSSMVETRVETCSWTAGSLGSASITTTDRCFHAGREVFGQDFEARVKSVSGSELDSWAPMFMLMTGAASRSRIAERGNQPGDGAAHHGGGEVAPEPVPILVSNSR